MKRIEQYIKEEMKDCPFTQEQEDKLLIGLTKFLDDLEQKQLTIHGVVKSLPTYKTIKSEKVKALKELNEKSGYRLTENEKDVLNLVLLGAT